MTQITPQRNLSLAIVITVVLFYWVGGVSAYPIENRGLTSIEGSYTSKDELVCAGVKVRSVVRCPVDHGSPLWQLECKQEFFIKNNKLSNISRNNATSWGCVKDKKNSNHYFVIDFFSGGNCWVCESTNVYDLQGNLILTDYLDYNDSNKCNKKNSKDIKTPEGFVDEFALMGCSRAAIRERERNRRQIQSLKRSNKNTFKNINFEREYDRR
jgi:hypothetical protein